MPISVIETLVFGCVHISTTVGGIVNVIEYGVSGFLSKSFSEQDFLDTLKYLIANQNSIDKKNLIKIYHDRFSIKQCAEKLCLWLVEKCHDVTVYSSHRHAYPDSIDTA